MDRKQSDMIVLAIFP